MSAKRLGGLRVLGCEGLDWVEEEVAGLVGGVAARGFEEDGAGVIGD